MGAIVASEAGISCAEGSVDESQYISKVFMMTGACLISAGIIVEIADQMHNTDICEPAKPENSTNEEI